MKYLYGILAVLAAAIVGALGVGGIVYGEADDSPGLQMLGLILVVGVIVYGVRTARRRKRG